LHYILASEKVEIIQTSKIKEHDQMKQLNTIIPNGLNLKTITGILWIGY
jgi:hypothetical protein